MREGGINSHVGLRGMDLLSPWHQPGQVRSRTRVSSSGTYLSMSSQAWEVALERREQEPGQRLRMQRRGEAKDPEIAEYVFIECVLLLSLL